MLVQRMYFDEEKKTVLEEKDIPDTGTRYARMQEPLDKEKRKKTQRKLSDFIEEANADSINSTTSPFRSNFSYHEEEHSEPSKKGPSASIPRTSPLSKGKLEKLRL